MLEVSIFFIILIFILMSIINFMQQCFNYIGLIGCPRYSHGWITHKSIYLWLIKNGYKVIIESQVSQFLSLSQNSNIGTLSKIGECCDLAIVIGGDGNLLSAAYVLSGFDIKIIGINRGNLGFLTDLNPDTALQQLEKVLSGKYILDYRFLLEIQIHKENGLFSKNIAVNEIVLHADKVAHMIEFEVYIDKQFSFSQKSDGLIISTPTGSTGYSLSAGGPILFSSLDAIVLVPMFPHTLSSRPLVINNSSTICLRFPNISNTKLKISCDSQRILSIHNKDIIYIRRSNDYLMKLIHPNSYNYFDTLSEKLNWSKKHF